MFDFSFSLTNTYTFWSGLIGGTFLMLSYFGTDQSQVQRYLAAKSVDEARTSLLISAYWKIPLQALVLLVGVLVFVFYQFTRPPLLFNPAHERARARRRQPGGVLADARSSATTRRASPLRAAIALRGRSAGVYASTRLTGTDRRSDVNYIIPRFVLDHLPLGLAGLVHRRGDRRGDERDLRRAQLALHHDGDRLLPPLDRSPRRPTRTSSGCRAPRPAFWGMFACIVATYAVNLGSLIEVVNRFGSFFYGSILGVFLLAMIPRATGVGRVRRPDHGTWPR